MNVDVTHVCVNLTFVLWVDNLVSCYDINIYRWWAERQVNEILAEHPGELVRTGWKLKI